MMKCKTIWTKIFLTIFVIGLSIWIGGTIVRYAIAYDVFVPGTELELKNWYSDTEMVTTVHLFRIAAFYTIFGFCSAFVSVIVLFAYWKKDLKKHGWLFISFVLFFLATPIEFYLIYYTISSAEPSFFFPDSNAYLLCNFKHFVKNFI